MSTPGTVRGEENIVNIIARQTRGETAQTAQTGDDTSELKKTEALGEDVALKTAGDDETAIVTGDVTTRGDVHDDHGLTGAALNASVSMTLRR